MPTLLEINQYVDKERRIGTKLVDLCLFNFCDLNFFQNPYEGAIKQGVRKSVGRPKKLNPQDIIENEKLFPFIKASGSKGFDCSFCNRSFPGRRKLFRHFNVCHYSEIKSISDFNTDPNPKQIYDCKNRICRKVHGTKRKNEWCTECIELSQLPKPKIPRKVIKPVIKPQHVNQLCPECG